MYFITENPVEVLDKLFDSGEKMIKEEENFNYLRSQDLRNLDLGEDDEEF